MENVLLIVHLVIALFMIGVVLLQRSEGGALGIGGGGGGLVSARGAATALSKITWALAVGFLCTSLMLTIVSGGGRDTGSVFDGQAAGEEGGAIIALGEACRLFDRLDHVGEENPRATLRHEPTRR